jgi:hypothetical protein
MADEKKRITDYPEALTLSDNDYVMVDNGGANGTKKFKAKSLGGGSPVFEVIMGGLDRVYGTTTDNYIGTYNQWISIDAGKSFADYDEIILVACAQNDDTSTGSKNRVLHITPTYLLKYYDKLYIEHYHGSTTLYVKCCLDFTNNKFYLNNWNNLCPIALLGIKY